MSVERVNIDEQGSPWKEEHLARYFFVKDFAKEKIILDIACGTGFGSELLVKEGAEIVYAADVSNDAIAACKLRLQQYDSNRWVCHFQDGTKMNYPDSYFDFICSFETIEHIVDYKSFLKEIHRVLKPGGVFVISTPNALITNPTKGKPVNPYHVYEFDPDELGRLLEEFFEIELSAGQNVRKSYGVAPFLPSFHRRKLSGKEKVNFIYWRILLRMPSRIRNWIHKRIFHTPFYPAIEDYTFLKGDLNTAHVQYHICRKH
ncbi:MAG: methyltransferase domain-containing protein [Chitinophagaceae bacterium]|nr:methyltransferase domain-containing protein [Chitinophagaceae bacterium]